MRSVVFIEQHAVYQMVAAQSSLKTRPSKFRLLSPAVFTLLSLAGIACFFTWRARRVSDTKSADARARYEATLAAAITIWSAHRFGPVDAGAQSLKAAIAKSKLTVGAQLPRDAAETACEHLNKFFLAYSSNTFSDYLAFRAPIKDYVINKPRVEFLTSSLDYFRPLAAEPPSAPEALLEYWWHLNKGFGPGFIGSVAWDTLRIEFTDKQIEPEIQDFLRILPDSPVVGLVSFNPFFIFDDQPEGKFVKDGSYRVDNKRPERKSRRVFMVVGCIIRDPAPDSPVAIIYKAYWSDKHHQWLPYGIAIASKGRRIIPLF